jgi:hypothetical protein
LRRGNVAREAKFAWGTLGKEVVGELEGCAGLRGDGGDSEESAQGQEALGLVEAEACAEVTGGGAEDSTAKGGVEGAEAFELDGDGGLRLARSGADGAATAADGFAWEKKLGKEAVELGLPAGLLFAGQLGEVREGLVEAGVLLPEERKDGVADAVAGEGLVGVGGVFAPWLILPAEEGLDVCATGLEEWAEDSAFCQGDDRVDGAEALGPGAAEELHEDGFGLVVEGVGGEDRVGVAGVEEGGEEIVADGAGGLFDGFAGFGCAGGDVRVVKVERDFEGDAEIFDETLVGVGLGCAEAVIDVDCAEADAESVVPGCIGSVESQEQGYGVGTARDGDADAVTGFDVGAIEDERGGLDSGLAAGFRHHSILERFTSRTCRTASVLHAKGRRR